MTSHDVLDRELCLRVIESRDRRYDGVFYTGVRTTGIYCRPSCPARPRARNVTFHPTAAAAQAEGYRACKRCLPDATPGSPQWDVSATAAGRAMRLIADGVVDREGVPGLAGRVGYTPRHLGRILSAELGAGPLALARAQRAQTARTLIETTDLALTDVAFAAGFTSVRQFNQTLREVYAANPTELRGHRRPAPGARHDAGRDAGAGAAAGVATIRMRLAVRTPFAGSALLDFLAYHLVAGVETAGPGWYARTLDLPHGTGTVRLELRDEPEVGGTAQVVAVFALTDLRDTTAAVQRVRRLLDADCDPLAVHDLLDVDPLLGPLARARPGLRVPGQVDAEETAIRTVIGQQISVTGARTVTGRIVAEHGRAVATGQPGLTHLFPDAATLGAVDPTTMPMPRARGRALVGLAAALVTGDVCVDRGPDRDDVRRALVALPGIGPWTADYVAMRALGHPDVFLPTDLGVRTALTRLGHDPVDVAQVSRRWRPWRSYALMHLWATLMPAMPAPDSTSTSTSTSTPPRPPSVKET